MSEPAKTPFDLLLDQIRAVVREEIATALNGNHSADKLMDVEQTADYLQQSTDWVYKNWRKIGGRKIGPKSVRFCRKDLEKWLATRKI